MKARDIMTTTVITVGPSAKIEDAARLMCDRRAGAVLVTDENRRAIGIVSEADLLHRQEIGTARRRSWWLNSAAQAAAYTKSHATRVRDVMTAPAVTIGPDASLADVAEVLERNRIEQLPVVEAGRVVGMIGRANIIQALASAKELAVRLPLSDRKIRERVYELLAREPWSTKTTNVTVTGGVVTFWGLSASEEEQAASRVLAENVAGVKRVEDRRGLRDALAYAQ